MKWNIKKIIGVILILVGVALIAATVYMKYDASVKQKELRKKFDDKVENMTRENKDKESNSNNNSEKSENTATGDAIGVLIIPKIDINVAISEGVSDETLKYAVAHFEETAKPGEVGNFCIAGHRNFLYAEYFKSLDKLQTGDEIIVKTKDKQFVYKVTQSFIVDPDKGEVLDKTDDKSITLVTCTIGAKQRLIVKGKLYE